MSAPPPRERLFRLSLREMLVLCAMCAVALVSLLYASDAWQLVVGTLTLVALFAATIVALVDRKERQAFAIGFTISMVLYGLILSKASLGTADGQHREFNPETGILPTTQLLSPLYTAIADVRWIDFRSGQEVPNPNRTDGGQGANTQFISMAELPERGDFMRIGHCWWAMLLGYVGGRFARLVYWRRIARSDSLASGRP